MKAEGDTQRSTLMPALVLIRSRALLFGFGLKELVSASEQSVKSLTEMAFTRGNVELEVIIRASF